jgi:hypothetical protein
MRPGLLLKRTDNFFIDAPNQQVSHFHRSSPGSTNDSIVPTVDGRDKAGSSPGTGMMAKEGAK